MILNDLRHAWRALAKAPLASLTIVVTVALGLGVVAVLFTILNTLVFRADQVPGIDAMVAVERTPADDRDDAVLTHALFEALRTDTQVFSDAYATVPGVVLHAEGRRMAVTLVTGDFFKTVRVAPVMGRALTPGDDAPAGGRPVLVLSHKGWERHFQRDPHVIGRTVLVNGAPFEIVGVAPAGFRGLEVGGPDLWAPLSSLAQFRPDDRGREHATRVEIVGRLRPGVSRESARAQLAAWDANRSARTPDRPVATLDVVPRHGTVPQPLEAVALFTPLFLAFGLILLIGCANVANLLLARGMARQREIGVRLSPGASRWRIVRQLLTESVLLASAAAAGGYLISRLALAGAVSWVMRSVPLDIGEVDLGVPAADWRVAAFLVVGALVATAAFALMPALRATAIDPMRPLRGGLVHVPRPGPPRHALIGLQVLASALLLICTAIFLRSGLAAARFDPGLRTADTVLIDIDHEPARPRMIQALSTDATIAASAAVRPQLLAPLRLATADPEAGAGKTRITLKAVSGSYFDVLGIPIVQGRTFLPYETDRHPVAVVSASVARALWPDGGAVGRRVTLEPLAGVQAPNGLLRINPRAAIDDAPMPVHTVTVIGLAGDVAGLRFTGIREAGVFLPTSLDAAHPARGARAQGPPTLARQALLDRLTPIDPNLGSIVTLQSVARTETFFLQAAFLVSLVLGALALVLTVSGLFSVLSYLVEQRTREIGVRMALGASPRTVMHLVLAQVARPVMLGLVTGAALALALATTVLALPVGAVMAPIVHLTDPVAYLASLALIAAVCLLAAWIPAARAARGDPMRTLREV